MTENRKPKVFYGYVVAAASFGIEMISWGVFITFGIFFTPLLTEFGWSRATISGANSVSMLLSGVLSIIVGGLNDRFGPRVVMTICGFLFGLGIILMSQVNTTWQLYLFWGVIVGIGISAMDVVPLSTTARWFVKKRGMMSGIVKCGTGLGILIMSLVASGLISAYSWRSSYIILGTLALVFMTLVAQFLRRDPGQMGLLPDGREHVTTGSLHLAEEGLALREAIHTMQFWAIFAIFLIAVFCIQTITIHIVRHAMDLNIPMTSAAGILSIVGGVSIAGRLVMGSASDRVGVKWALVVCFLILVTALSWLQFARELWMFYLFAAVYGFGQGGFFALLSPAVAELFGMRSQGAILGAVIFGYTIGGAIGPLLAGRIFDITSSYRLAFLINTVLSIVGLILALLLRPISKERRNK